MVTATDLTPIGDSREDRSRFAAALGPCLALTAPSGMSEMDRRAWIDAAFIALRHLPADVIEAGAREAIKTADHPSKVVPTIIAATESEMGWRRRMHRPAATPSQTAQALPAPGQERCTPEEAAEIVAELAKRMKAVPVKVERNPWEPTPIKGGSDKPPRKPTREDYIAMGVDPAVLDKIEAENAQDEAA